MVIRRASRFTQLLALVLCVAGALLLTAYRAEAAVDPTAFVDELVMTVPGQTIAGDWLPDGRLLTLTRLGQVSITDPALGTSSVVLTMSDVGTTGNRGAPDLELHPDFAVNDKFFVYHLTSSEPAALKIVEFTLDENSASNTANSIQQIWENPGPDHAADFHIGGSLDISHDGKLLLTIGDGLVQAQATQLDNVFGKVIRLDLDGTPASDNPWFGDGDTSTLDDIWAYGLRNPFRASVDPVTGVHWVADVGGNVAAEAYEEVNQIVKGGNYGWPNCEGPLVKQGAQQGPDCPAGVVGPWHYYDHFDIGRSITGGEVYRGTAMPAEMRGSYIFSDYIKDVMTWVEVNVDGSAGIVNEIDMIATSRPVWVSAGPDGWIYYLRYHPGGPIYELRRIRYTGPVDQPPVVNSITATPTTVSLGDPVAFSSDVNDPDQDPISYLWDFGDGNSSTDVVPTHVYADEGTYGVSLDITANGVQASSGVIDVQVGAAACDGEIVTIMWGPGAAATNGPDVILGTSGPDVINGLAGDDVICGLGGADVINGGSGADTIYGGDGEDVIGGQGGADLLYGEGDNDRINGGIGNDQAWGGDGDDDLRGQGDDDTLNGGIGVDQFFGGSGNDIIDTGSGGNLGTSQVVRGQGNNDIITGSPQDDDLDGGPGLDELYGLAGNDRLRGGNASDDLFGGPGMDTLEGGAQRDFLYGGDDDDDLAGGTGNDDLFGESGDDALNGQGGVDLCNGGITGETNGDITTGSCETAVNVP